MHLFVYSFLLVLTTGCASTVSPYISKQLAKPLACKGEAQCKVMWDRAVYFVNTNAAFKIQTVNDNMIETYNPSRYSPKLAFRIIKQPLGDGAYRIRVKAWCDNLFGCSPNELNATVKAKNYIRSGVL